VKSMILTAAFSAIALGAPAADRTWTGTISDTMCGANHASMGPGMEDRPCTQACAKGGVPYALVADGRVYRLANHESDLRAHAGHRVNLTGELKGDTIRVSMIEMP
jgi:hypothetical protein